MCGRGVAKIRQAVGGGDWHEGDMHHAQVALVTGASRGIGRGIAGELAARGFTVLVGARDRRRGQAAAAEMAGDARAIALDVTSADSIAAAAAWIERELGRLDVLVNNAAIAIGAASGATAAEEVSAGAPSTASLADIRRVFETNVFGVVAVTQAMLPLLRRAPAGRIVNLSSTLGSLTVTGDPAFRLPGIGGIAYGPSKTALNAITVAFAQELAGTAIKVNAVCPGHVATDLNRHTGTRTVAEAVREPVRLALLGPDGPTGTFSSDAGRLPW